ncbi:hypothetical protein BC937DRAFT_87953 [Endogone sp. FLAS-F59071]|nr:hypothetical protein BC937DRAFT_87953 [Endogone sp. FLAS-F59071]|eukprot:RUS19139.1 hypothetical protein BC937DRAFT_87953 [Endogone sp. FLAS-F59071]
MAMVDDFTNYDWFARSDDITILKDIILKLHNAYVDKETALQSADAQIEYLNAEVQRQQKVITVLTEENKRVREKMQTTANDITEMEDNFARWQATLIKQQDDERKLYAKENAQKHVILANKVVELEESLQVASEEITRLTITVAELTDTAAYVTNIASQSENLMASTDKEYIAKLRDLEQDKKDLTEQIIDITKRRMQLQTLFDKMEEENEQLKLRLNKATTTIASLTAENGLLKEREKRFSLVFPKTDVVMEEIILD